MQAVLFDLDHTLFDHVSAARRGLAALAGSWDVEVSDEIDEVWFAIEDQEYARYMAGETDLFGQRRTRFRLFSQAVTGRGIDATDAEADAGWTAYYDAYVAGWRAFEESIPTLRVLRERGLKIGIITNGHHPQQVLKTERSGLAPYLDDVVSSGQTGIAKPDPRIFRLACERLGIAPSSALFVGDNYAVDVEGAWGAGLAALHIDRAAERSDGVITRIDQVIDWLDGAGSTSPA